MGFMKLGGMTFGGLFKKPETVLYPFETKPAPEGLKGTVAVDETTCILCGICQKRCPCDAIAVDKAARTWSINRFSCIQCGYCTRECPKNSLSMEPAQAPVGRSKDIAVFTIPETRTED